MARYKSQKEFNEGNFNEELKVMSRRKVYMTEQAEVANYVCKYSKKLVTKFVMYNKKFVIYKLQWIF